MSKSIPAILQEAHRLRKLIRDLQSEIELGPRVMKIQEQKLADEHSAHKLAYDTISKLKLKIREDEVSHKAATQQLAKYENQLNEASSPKEYEAKKSEIRQAQEKVSGLEEQILAQMEELDRLTADLPNVEKRWKDAQAEFEQYKVDARERLDHLTQELKLAQTKLAEEDAQLSGDVKTAYDRLISRYGPDGLAAVNGRTCQHCRTSITEQQKIQIQTGKFVCCPNCGRGLYLLG